MLFPECHPHHSVRSGCYAGIAVNCPCGKAYVDNTSLGFEALIFVKRLDVGVHPEKRDATGKVGFYYPIVFPNDVREQLIDCVRL